MPNPYDSYFAGNTAAPAQADPTDNPYDSYFDDQKKQQTAALRANAQSSQGVNPDKYAKDAQTARIVGVPTAAVTPAPQVPNRIANGMVVDHNTQGAPVARQAYTDPNFANVAHDDSHNVGLLDRLFAGVPGANIPGLLNSAVDGIGGLFGYKPGDLQSLAEASAVSSGKAFVNFAEAAGSAVANHPSVRNLLATVSPLATMAAGMATRSNLDPVNDYLDTKSQELESKVTQQGHLADLARLAGGLAPYLLAGEGAPIVMGISGVGQEAEEAKNAGTFGSGRAEVAEAVNGALQTILGKYIGGDQISGLAGKLLPDAFTSTIGRSIATGLASRAVGASALGAGMQLGSNAITKGLINPDQSLTEGVGDSAEQMLLLDLGMHALHVTGGAIGMRLAKVAQGQSDAHVLDGLNMVTEASKVQQRAPEVWHSYLQAVTEAHGAPEDVYVSQDAFAKTFSTPEGQVALEKMPEAVKDAAEIAAKTGGDIKIPTADFGTHVAGSPLYEQLADHIKFDPNSFTRAEADEVLKTEGPRVLAELETAVKSKQDTDAFTASRNNVESSIKDQLNAAGKFSPAVNAINAKLGAHSIASFAARVGMTPEAFHAEHGFSIANGEARTGSQAESDATLGPENLPGDVLDHATRMSTVQADATAAPADQQQTLTPPQIDTLRAHNIDVGDDGTIKAADQQRLNTEVQRRTNGGQRVAPSSEIDKAGPQSYTGHATAGENGADGERGRAGERASVGNGKALADVPKIAGAAFGPVDAVVSAAEDYAKQAGIDLKRQANYVEVDPEFATRLAQAYTDMVDARSDPKVKEAYENLIKQTRAQYDSLVASGHSFSFGDPKSDYFKSGWNALRDLRENKSMKIFATADGYGSDEDLLNSDNPMLAATGLEWPDHNGTMLPVLANDLFRAVHDAFGHGMEGAGFRGRGEENAWQSHSRLFTGSALEALTTETRGQNSWVNYGPDGEFNRKASLEDTKYAEQKIGLLPDWASTENRAADMEPRYDQTNYHFKEHLPVDRRGPSPDQRGDVSENARSSPPLERPPVDAEGKITLDHFTVEKGLTQTDPTRWGRGGRFLPPEERSRKGIAPPRSYFGIATNRGGYVNEFGSGTHPGNGLPMERVTGKIDASKLYDMTGDPDGLKAIGRALPRDDRGLYEYKGKKVDGETLYEKLIQDAGYSGYWTKELGMSAAVFDPVDVRPYDAARDDHTVEPEQVYNQNSADAIRRQPETNGEATGVRLENSLDKAKQIARDGKFATGRDLKVVLQDRSNAAQEETGVSLKGLDAETAKRISDHVVEDALEAVQDNGNAIGWYDRSVTQAKAEMARVFPELQTDPHANFAFTWALAVTSNGLKVDKNFELAAKAYETWKETGKFPTDIGIGQAAKAINDSLARYSTLIDHFGSWEKARDFMVKEHTVRDVEKETGIEVSGESKGEIVRGAAILGPKIGNGFFSNLYGHFDGLTMDRWLTRSVGRWRGTLIKTNAKMEAQKHSEIGGLVSGLEAGQRRALQKLFAGSDAKISARMTKADINTLAEEVQKRSVDPKWRSAVNDLEGGEDLRKLGNGLAKYLDGQVEAPASGKERTFIRKAFNTALDTLKQKPGLESLTMADLQALLWYPEKLLYESAKKPVGQEVRSYEDDEAPDYANAARKFADNRLGKGEVSSGGTEPPARDGSGPSADGSGLGDQSGSETLNQPYPKWGQSDVNDARGTFTPSTNTIDLLKGADLSTFIHELGHYHLETLHKFSSTNESAAEDFSHVLKWFEPNMSTDQWGAMGFEERRPYHEKFAQGFESYLFEGKSPTPELRSIFQRMSAWMKNVYRSIRSLGTELSPEVRGVMDRLVATPTDIAAAEREMNYKPAFEAKPEFMSDDQWASYQTLGFQATIDATEKLGTRTVKDLQWIEGAKSRALKKLQDANNDLRNETRKEVTASVMSERVERAREFLKFGRVDGEDIGGPHRLDIEEVDKALEGSADADEIKRKLSYGKYGMLGKGGIDPELVAESHGYSSANEMLHELAEQPALKDKIRTTTDQTMLERYGDVNDPQKMSEAAIEAIHNDARGRMLATEFSALERAVGRKSDLTKAAKQMAEHVVGEMKVGDLKPDRFRAEQVKAGEKADRALRENNLEEAAAQKRAQLLNFHLAKAIDEAKTLADKQVAYLKGFDKKSRRDRIGTSISLIDTLLNHFDLKAKASSKETVMQSALQDWYHSAMDGGMEPHVDERLMEVVQKTPYRELTTSMLTGLHDTVDSIARIARAANNVMIEGKQIAVGKAVSDLTVPLEERGEHFTPQQIVEPPKSGVDPWLPVALHKIQTMLSTTFRGSLTGQDFKVNRYDMHQIQGPFSKYIFGRLIDQNYFKIDMTSKVSAAFAEKAKELGKKWQGSMTDIVPNTELLDPKTGQALKMTRSKMLRMATHVGNESNFKKMTEGWGWDQAKVWDFLRTNMTAEDWGASQFVMDQFEPIYKMSTDMIKRLGNVLPDKIPARSFTVETPDGKTITMRGGYSPIDYDPLRSKLAERLSANENAPTSAIDPAARNYKATTTSNGALKSRIEGYTDVVNLDFNAVSKNLRDSIHDLAYREALIDIGKIMKNEGFRDKFMLTYGRSEYVAMQKLMDNIRDLNQRDDAMTVAEKAFQYTRQGVVITGIGYRLSTVGKHGTSAALKSLGYSAGGGSGYFMSRVARLATGNAGADITEARAKFPEIRARLLQMDRDYRVKEQAMLKGETLLQKNERYGHALVAWSDALSAVATAHAAYDWATTDGIPTKLGGTGLPMEHDAAVKYADKIVREAHGSALETSRSNFMHERGVSSLLGMIYGFQNNTLGQMLDTADKIKLGKGNGIANSARIMATLIVPAIATMYISHGGPDENEGWGAWTAEAIGGELASTVPFVRDCWKAIESQIRYGKMDATATPLGQVMSNVLNVPFDIHKELSGIDSKIIKHAFDSLGQVFHIAGMGQLGHMIQYQRDVNNGKVQVDGPGDYAKHLLVGGSNKKQ